MGAAPAIEGLPLVPTNLVGPALSQGRPSFMGRALASSMGRALASSMGQPLGLLRQLAPLLLVGLAAPAPATGTAGDPARPEDPSDPDDPSDEVLRAAWERLDEGGQGEVVAWFRAEVGWLGTFQTELVRHVLGTVEGDPRDWPAAPERPPLFDPQVHAPRQPIPRRWVDDTVGGRGEWVQQVQRPSPARRLRPGWRYDHGQGTVLSLPGRDDPGRIFENALAGFPPDLDLAEALVERTLDGGDLRAVHAAFGHAYADREGNAYPRVTLYDAWRSGLEIEMPDVECLGIVHLVLDEWDRWRAPVPRSEHDDLYEAIEELFREVFAQREVRRALARTYLTAEPVLLLAQTPHLDRLHALWERFSSDPAALARDLPRGGAATETWLQERGREVDRERAAWAAGLRRKRVLASGAKRVRGTLVAVMREFGALDRP